MTEEELRKHKAAQRVAVKYDSGKASMHLLPFKALEEVGKVMAFGAKKYSDHNWRHGMAWSRLLAAGLRHLCSWAAGQDKDEESGLSHLAHAAFCVLALLEFSVDGGGVDDRWKDSQLTKEVTTTAFGPK